MKPVKIETLTEEQLVIAKDLLKYYVHVYKCMLCGTLFGYDQPKEETGECPLCIAKQRIDNHPRNHGTN